MNRKEAMEKSLQESGQLNPIIKDSFGLTVDGVKREKILGKDVEIVTNENIKSVEDHLKALEGLNPPKMSIKEKVQWAQVYYKQYKDAGWKEADIDKAIAKRLGCSIRSVQYYKIGQTTFKKNKIRKFAKNVEKQLFKIQKEFPFLSQNTIIEGLKKPIILCRAIKKHLGIVSKVVDLGPVEKEKLKADIIKEVPANANLFFPLLEEYEKLHPGKKIEIIDVPAGEE